MKSIGIVCFRNDLRLEDNFALDAAVHECDVVVPVFIWNEDQGSWAAGAASRWWLHESLTYLSSAIAKLGSKLIILKGDFQTTILKILSQIDASAVYWNRRYDPFGVIEDKDSEKTLIEKGIAVRSFNSGLLHEPHTVLTKSGEPYKVFTPFWNQCSGRINVDLISPAPERLCSPKSMPNSLSIDDLGLKPKIDWTAGMRQAWIPGELGAKQQLDVFIDEMLERYQPGRDIPAEDSVSKLSPHLHFGEIGPRQIWHAVSMAARGAAKNSKLRVSADVYLKEIGWREFAHHVLFHFPHTAEQPLQLKFRKFPWRDDQTQLTAWQKGKTGYPIVDAGMRQLWHTGWMHNRVRMVVASFLTKHLLISWAEGSRWFWDTLVDADLANNTLGWQWAGGCGADAAPYFRIFNPELQGEKFDPDGTYVKRWCPELKDMPAKWIHKPWKAPEAVLSSAGVQLGKTYPLPLVDHSFARTRALAALESTKASV